MTDRAEHLAERAAALLRAGHRAPIPCPEQGGARRAQAWAPPLSSAIHYAPAAAARSASLRFSCKRPLERAGSLASRCRPAARTWSRRGFRLAAAVVPWAYLTTVVWAQAAGGGAAAGGAADTSAGDSGNLRGLLQRLQPNQPATGNEKAWTFGGAVNVSVGATEGNNNNGINGINGINANGRNDWSFVGVLQPEFYLTGDTRRATVRLYYSPVLSAYSDGRGTRISHYLSGDATVAIVPDWLYFDLRAYASDVPRFGGFYYGGYGYGTTAYGSSLVTPLYSNNSSVQTATVSASPYMLHTFDGWGTARAGYTLTRTWLGDGSNSVAPGYGTTGNLTTNREFASFTTGENFYRFNNDISLAADQYSGGSSLYQGADDFTVTDTASYAINRWLAVLGSVGYEEIKYAGPGAFRGNFFNWTVGARLTPNPDSSLTIQYGRKEGDYTWLFNGYYTPTPRLYFYGTYNVGITTYLQRLQNAVYSTAVGPSGVLVNQQTGVPVSVVSPFGINNGVSRVRSLNVGASYILNREAFSASVSHEEDTTLSPSVSSTGTVVGTGVTGTGTAGSLSWQHDLNPATYLTSTFTYGVSNNGAFVGTPGTSTDYWAVTSQLSHRFTQTVTGTASFSHAEQFGASGTNARFLNYSQNLILVGLRKTF